MNSQSLMKLFWSNHLISKNSKVDCTHLQTLIKKTVFFSESCDKLSGDKGRMVLPLLIIFLLLLLFILDVLKLMLEGRFMLTLLFGTWLIVLFPKTLLGAALLFCFSGVNSGPCEKMAGWASRPQQKTAQLQRTQVKEMQTAVYAKTRKTTEATVIRQEVCSELYSYCGPQMQVLNKKRILKLVKRRTHIWV